MKLFLSYNPNDFMSVIWQREQNLARVLIAKELDRCYTGSWKVKNLNSCKSLSKDFKNLFNASEVVVLDIMAYFRFRGSKSTLLDWVRRHPRTALYISDVEKLSLDLAKHFKFVFGEAGYLLPSYAIKPHSLLPHATSPVAVFPETLHHNVLIPQRHGLDNPTRFMSNFYSERIRLAKIASKCPGVVVQKCFSKAENYQMILGSYLGCFVALPSESYPNLVAKFFEVPASGSLLIAYTGSKHKIFESLGWKDRTNYFNVTPSTIAESFAFILDPANCDEIKKIRRAGYELVCKHHTIKHRTAEFIQMIRKEFFQSF